jgi:hypothetical protein
VGDVIELKHKVHFRDGVTEVSLSETKLPVRLKDGNVREIVVSCGIARGEEGVERANGSCPNYTSVNVVANKRLLISRILTIRDNEGRRIGMDNPTDWIGLREVVKKSCKFRLAFHCQFNSDKGYENLTPESVTRVLLEMDAQQRKYFSISPDTSNPGEWP